MSSAPNDPADQHGKLGLLDAISIIVGIVIGTTIDARRGDAIPHHITPVVDMRDELSPLKGGTKRSNDFEGNNEHTGGI